MKLRTGLFGACLLLATVCAGCNAELGGSTIGIKGGVHWGEDPLTGGRESQTQWQADLTGPRWYGDRVAITGSAILPAAFDVHTASVSQVGDETVTTDFADEFASYDLRLGVAYWPWRTTGINPYLTAGIGYWSFDREITTTITSVVGDTSNAVKMGSRERGDRFYPWLGVGMRLPIVEVITGVVEVGYDFGKRYHGDELGGFAIMAGVQWELGQGF